MKDPYAEIELQISRTLDYLAAVADAKTEADYGTLYRQILTALDASMQSAHPASADRITSDQVTLYVRDEATGHMYCRTLPLDYRENSNGITLSGENIHGKTAEIAFLSNTAVNKIQELLGKGPDLSPCKDD